MHVKKIFFSHKPQWPKNFFFVFYIHHLVSDVFSYAEYKSEVRIAQAPIVLKQIAKKRSKEHDFFEVRKKLRCDSSILTLDSCSKDPITSITICHICHYFLVYLCYLKNEVQTSDACVLIIKSVISVVVSVVLCKFPRNA